MQAGAVDVHDVFLIAGAPVAGTLEDQAPAIGAEVGLGVLATIGKLADVGEMAFRRLGRNESGSLVCAAGGRSEEEQGAWTHDGEHKP